ncbi:MAG: hypothetical protein JW749_03695 [Sedimentisphaerales bacterium]|nr:hypothetical protein [Sedimentisphaerales bacterium]
MPNDNGGEKTQITTSKSFLAVGPTLHYSHAHVITFWLLTVISFTGVCLFWTKILTGSGFSFNLELATSSRHWRIGQLLLTGVSIFEYPWQIVVVSLLMATLAVVPVLTSQLLSFIYSVPMILAVFFLADLPAFAVCLLISCIAVACRPLRFRSRFASILLCMLPQLLYWFFYGGAKGVEPIKWGFSFTPWIAGWLIGLGMAGFVIGIGHFTRYRPGMIWLSTTITLVLAFLIFSFLIGFDELDYQLYVARNNPEQISEFHDHSIEKTLDQTIRNPGVVKYLSGFFYPTESIALRKELKAEIKAQLVHDRWPTWFAVPEQLRYQEKREWLFRQCDLFITGRPKSKRMPIALYYKALLSEYAPDYRIFDEKEILHFYSDYPFDRSRLIWYRLYTEFSTSPESLEARWRIAMHWAGQGKFEEADAIIADALMLLGERLKNIEKQQLPEESLFSIFAPPPDTVMTVSKLTDLQRKLNQLRTLISADNRTDRPDSANRLARFVMLNTNNPGYAGQLDQLLSEMGKSDPLRDNILLAQVKLIADEQRRAERLSELHNQYANTDAGCLALYELALLKIHFWRQQDETNAERKKQYLADARATLNNFIRMYPSSFCVHQVRKNLASLPAAD